MNYSKDNETGHPDEFMEDVPIEDLKDLNTLKEKYIKLCSDYAEFIMTINIVSLIFYIYCCISFIINYGYSYSCQPGYKLYTNQNDKLTCLMIINESLVIERQSFYLWLLVKLLYILLFLTIGMGFAVCLRKDKVSRRV